MIIKQTLRSLLAGTVLAAAFVTTGFITTADATENRKLRVYTNQQFVEDLAVKDTLKIKDAASVFQMVLDSLPDRVTIYPTENYYYFKFNYGGVQYSGNIRLENERRDQGQVHFAFAPELTEWRSDDDAAVFKVLTKADGVTIEKINDLSYRVSLGAKTVVFDLNDLRHVKPPADAMSRDERFIGPVFDESGVRFLLVYNPKLKAFHYLLDETITPNESFTPSPATDRILIGKRTGFAFYRDHKLNRKILIGVYEGNSRVNNYYDGPFDQLPDNFIEGNSLHDAILDVAPNLKGRIDRYGSSFDGETRYMVAPYTHYTTQDDLMMFHNCATSKDVPADQYHLCFVYDESEDDAADAAPPPEAPQQRAPATPAKKASVKK